MKKENVISFDIILNEIKDLTKIINDAETKEIKY
jgi:hypothetical protein